MNTWIQSLFPGENFGLEFNSSELELVRTNTKYVINFIRWKWVEN